MKCPAPIQLREGSSTAMQWIKISCFHTPTLTKRYPSQDSSQHTITAGFRAEVHRASDQSTAIASRKEQFLSSIPARGAAFADGQAAFDGERQAVFDRFAR